MSATLVVVQARSGSTRLPGKILKPLSGRPLLERMIERVRAATARFDVVVATTTEGVDDVVAELCRAVDVACFRGHPTDLLDRHVRAARACKADVVVKIPSDCPLVDPGVIDRVLGAFTSDPARFDFVSNLHPATYPDGNDVEVVPLEVLEIAWREATKPHEREHTTPFVWDRPQRFRVGNVIWERGIDYSMTHRFTVDYAEDYAFVAAVYDELYAPSRPVFSLGDVLSLLEARPDILSLNARYAGVNWYRNHLGELRTVRATETKPFP